MITRFYCHAMSCRIHGNRGIYDFIHPRSCQTVFIVNIDGCANLCKTLLLLLLLNCIACFSLLGTTTV